MNECERVLSKSDEQLIIDELGLHSLLAAVGRKTIQLAEQATLAKLAEQQPDVTQMLKALERIANMDSMSYHNLDSAKIIARNALAADSIPCVSPTSDKTGCVSENGENDRQLARHQPCGCVICYCENQERCLGCGAKYCGTHEIDETPNPVYVDHIADASKMVAEMYWINPDYPSSDSIIEAFEPITTSVEVNVGDRYEVSRAIRLPDITVEVTELEENGDVKAYKVVGGDHITEPVLD